MELSRKCSSRYFISLNYLCTQELKTYSGNGFYIHVISKFSSSLRENEMHSFNTINAQQIFTTVQFTINYIWTTYKTCIFNFFMWDNDIIGRRIVWVFNFRGRSVESIRNKAPICISNCTFPYYQLFVQKTWTTRSQANRSPTWPVAKNWLWRSSLKRLSLRTWLIN